jgi:hypothetical protein
VMLNLLVLLSFPYQINSLANPPSSLVPSSASSI